MRAESERSARIDRFTSTDWSERFFNTVSKSLFTNTGAYTHRQTLGLSWRVSQQCCLLLFLWMRRPRAYPVSLQVVVRSLSLSTIYVVDCVDRLCVLTKRRGGGPLQSRYRALQRPIREPEKILPSKELAMPSAAIPSRSGQAPPSSFAPLYAALFEPRQTSSTASNGA